MKFLFASSDIPAVVSVQNILVRAGIPCDILHQNKLPVALDRAFHPELWIHREDDFLAASMLLASQRRHAPSAFQ